MRGCNEGDERVVKALTDAISIGISYDTSIYGGYGKVVRKGQQDSYF